MGRNRCSLSKAATSNVIWMSGELKSTFIFENRAVTWRLLNLMNPLRLMTSVNSILFSAVDKVRAQ